MDASARPGQAVRKVSRARRRRAATLLLALLIALATGALLLSSFSQNASAHAPAGSPANPLDTPTPTATPVVPPTLTLVSPSSGTGPVGAKLTVSGEHWGGAVDVGAIPGTGDCSNKSGWAKSFGSPKPNGSGHISFSFTWPTSLNQTSGPYSICATNASGTATVPYQVSSAAAPALAFSVDSAQVGVVMTINGSNFVGAGSITITAQGPQGSARLVTTVTPLDNGTFSVPFTPTVRDVGSVTIRATSAAEGGAPSAIAVSSKLQVVAAATATATIEPSPTTAGSGIINPPASNSGSSPTAIVLIVVAILFALLAIAGVVIFLLVRRRGVPGGPDGEDPAFYGPGSQPGGYGPYGQTAYGATPPRGYPSGDQFGRSGFGGMSGTYPGGASQVGGVASWDDGATEEDAGPGPDWHPRPMTGHWRAPDASDYRPEGYGPGAVDPRDAAGFAPPDPWANDDADPYGTNRAPAGNYGASRPGQGANLPPRGGPGQQRRNPWGESWRDAPTNQQGGYPRQPANGDDPDDPNGYTGW